MTRIATGTSANVIVDHEKCIAAKGCRTCVDVCPTDILAYDEASGRIVMTYDECWYCLPCQHDCPTKAIRVEMPYQVR